MIVKAYMCAFAKGAIREIEIPNDELVDLLVDVHEKMDQNGIDRLLGLVWQYGQNDFQPRNLPSLSVGDVVELHNGDRYRVLGAGWEKLGPDEDPLGKMGQQAIFESYGFLKGE
jgi:hypothetical protein